MALAMQAMPSLSGAARKPPSMRVRAPRRAAAVSTVTIASVGSAGRGSHSKETSSSAKRGMKVVARGKKEDAAKRALMGAMSGKGDVLSENDGGGGWFGGFFGGGGGGDNWWGEWYRRLGPSGSIIAVILAFLLFKPVTAILVNLVYYLAGWPLDTPPKVGMPGAGNVAADADIIARYGADDDDDDDDE